MSIAQLHGRGQTLKSGFRFSVILIILDFVLTSCGQVTRKPSAQASVISSIEGVPQIFSITPMVGPSAGGIDMVI
jgi:hypothetical protein